MFEVHSARQDRKPAEPESERGDAALDKKNASENNPAWQSLALNPASRDEQTTREHVQTKRVQENDSGEAGVPPIVQEALESSSEPLEPTARAVMESRMGQDFSQVRVHTDALGAGAASAINARAFTANRDIVFGAGEYNPQTEAGRRLLGHELTHVVQQRAGVQLNNGIGEAGDSHERQADAVAHNLMQEGSDRNLINSNLQHLGPSSASANASGMTVQRQDAVDVFDTAAATAVKDKWAKEGATSESDIARQLDKYKKWRDKYDKALAAMKKAKKPALTEAELATAETWVGTYETHEQWKAVGAGKEPADPGAAPAELAKLGGNPPAPAYEKIKNYEVTVPGGSKYSYTDHVQSGNTVRDTGVGSSGTVGGKQKISDVFDKAGVSAPDTAIVKKVFSVLSSLEGKFDAINTYDAGYVSAGFIQFISGASGSGSLADVLRNMKAKNPTDFTSNFHDLGIDVDANGIVVVDPADGKVLHGADAVQKIIGDKRLTAVFQEAGKGDSFQQAQARIAYEQYYVPDKSFSLKLTVKDADPAATNKTKTVTVTGKYKDVLLSEAGKVAIVDRGVQHGTGGKSGSGGAAGRFLDACQEVVNKHDLTNPTAAELAKYESEIVPRLVNRYDVSADATLTQPAAAPAATTPTPTPTPTPIPTPVPDPTAK